METPLKTDVNPQNRACSKCQTLLICGAAQTGESCWCAVYPAVMTIPAQQDCLCEQCLSRTLQEKIAEFINTSTQQQAMAVARQYRDEGQLIQGIDYSIEQDNYVFTRWYHLKRGSCCQSGCKNCPY